VVDSRTVTDKQWIAADQDPQGRSPHAGNLYMSWTDVGGDRIVVARSTDGNRTWRPFVALASGPVQGSVPAVGPDGTVYVAWGRRIFGGPGPGSIEVRASRNGGASFGPVHTAANITSIPYFLPNGMPGRNFRSPGSMPAFAVSPTNGFLYAAWADYRSADADIYLARSTDAGATWGAPVRINDDPPRNGMDQFHPQLAVAPSGRVAVMWMDRRLPCPDLEWIPAAHRGRENFCITTFMARSTDGGETWSPNIQAGAEAWDWSVSLPTVSTDRGFTTGFIGDYQGLASGPDYDYPFWAATTDLGDNADHSQEVFVARVAADRDYQATATPTPSATPSPTLTPTATATATPTPKPRPLYLPRLPQGATAL
ncbi:MAG: sialidase family protein, partial [Anaerolineae bacterium]